MPTATSFRAGEDASSAVSFLVNSIPHLLAKFQEDPASERLWQDIVEARRAAAAEMVALPVGQKSGPGVDRARQTIRWFADAGIGDFAPVSEDINLARAYRTKGWPGLFAAMTLVSAWQWPDAPSIKDVPNWLWADYAEYVFRPPQRFESIGQADLFAAHALRRLDELFKLAAVNRGSSAVRAALSAYVRVSDASPLYTARGDLHRYLELRGKVFAIASGVQSPEPILPFAREGRKLRLGVVVRGLGSDTAAILPFFEHLDPERFEVTVYCQFEGHAEMTAFTRSRVAGITFLPPNVADQIAMLRSAGLDAIVFGSDLGGRFDAMVELALHRLAPLQLASPAAPATSGLPEIDLRLCGAIDGAVGGQEKTTERLGLLPCSAHVFELEGGTRPASIQWNRTDLGVPANSTLFVSTADHRAITPELQLAWAKLLSMVPDARLLVHPFQLGDASPYAQKRFAAQFDRVLANQGLASDRLVISTGVLPSSRDVRKLIQAGDVCLDTSRIASVAMTADALQAGVPVVAWRGDTVRSNGSAVVLDSVALGSCVAADEAAYLEIAVQLAKSGARREQVKRTIKDAMDRLPVHLDTLAASDGFGALLERAFDEIVESGDAFRSVSEPVVSEPVAEPPAALQTAQELFRSGRENEAAQLAERVLKAHPRSAEARQLIGALLLRANRADRAVSYFMAAIQNAESNAGLWHDLAIALRRAGHERDALHALRTSVQLLPARTDWAAMLNEWSAATAAD